MLPFPLDEIPFVGDFIDYYNQAINFLSHWCGETIIQLETLKEIEITGSGDTTFDYVKIFTTFLIALFLKLPLIKRWYGKPVLKIMRVPGTDPIKFLLFIQMHLV